MRGLSHFNIQRSAAALALYIGVLLGSALDGYVVGGVPVPWLSAAMLAVGLFLFRIYIPIPGIRVFLCFVGYSVIVAIVSALGQDYAAIMPQYANSSYPTYIFLRFLNLAAFISAVALVLWLLRSGMEASLVKWTIIIGTAEAVFAIYYYVATVYGLPRPDMNRMGTGGGPVPEYFLYAFHRALGTFREPSLFAEWLAVPLLLSFLGRSAFLHFCSIIMLSALFLSGSLTGIWGAALGLGVAMVATAGIATLKDRRILIMGLIVIAGLGGFSLFSYSYEAGNADLFGVLADRSAPIIRGGMASSNRDYIYNYVSDNPFPIFGVGMGNANILLSKQINCSIMVSFLSLYLNLFYATGWIGLVLMILFLIKPVVQCVGSHWRTPDGRSMIYLAGYLAWLVIYAVHAEELKVIFAIPYGLVVHQVSRLGSGRLS